MIGTLVDGVNGLVARLVRMSRFHWIVRGLLMGFALGWWWGLQALPGGVIATGLAWVIALCVLATAFWPDSWALGTGVALLALWVLAVSPPLLAMIALMAGLWLTHRLACWATTGPAHAVVDGATVRLLAVDALQELGLAVALGALVAAGWWLAGHLPSGGGWTWALLGLACLVGLAATGRPSRRGRAR